MLNLRTILNHRSDFSSAQSILCVIMLVIGTLLRYVHVMPTVLFTGLGENYAATSGEDRVVKARSHLSNDNVWCFCFVDVCELMLHPAGFFWARIGLRI